MTKNELIIESLTMLMNDCLTAEDLLTDTLEYDWLKSHDLIKHVGKVHEQEELYKILRSLDLEDSTKARIERTMRQDLVDIDCSPEFGYMD